jgi:hypothetical protein
VQNIKNRPHKTTETKNTLFKTVCSILSRANLNHVMEGEIEGKREGSPSANISWSSTDRAQRVFSDESTASQAAISIDPPGGNVQTGPLWTTTRKNDGVEKVKKQTHGEFDILCGRGRSFQEHSGNRILRQIVELHRERYKRAKRSQKGQIASEIVAAFNASGNIFLKHNGKNEFWEEIDDELAREKVSHCFRSSTRIPSSLSTCMLVSKPLSNFREPKSGRDQLPATRNNMTNILVRSSYQLPVTMHTPSASHLPTCWAARGCTTPHDCEISRYQFDQSGDNQLYYQPPVSIHTAISLSTRENADTSITTNYIEDLQWPG